MLTAEDIIQDACRRQLRRADLSRRDSRVLVDARRSEAMTLYCAGILLSSNLTFTHACIKCAHTHVTKKPRDAVIILSAPSTAGVC